MTTLLLKEAKERLEELLEGGESFGVRMEDGRTVLLEVKATQAPRPVFGSGKGWFSAMAEDFDAPLGETVPSWQRRPKAPVR